LTPFLQFALKGLAVQGGRLLAEIRIEMQKQVFRNTMYDLFGRLKSPRRRVLAKRQIEVLKVLLEVGEMRNRELMERIVHLYNNLKNWESAFQRDMSTLLELRAIRLRDETGMEILLSANLDWPAEISETEFLQKMKTLPKSKTRSGFTPD
jgi:hypothetical protein